MTCKVFQPINMMWAKQPATKLEEKKLARKPFFDHDALHYKLKVDSEQVHYNRACVYFALKSVFEQ